MKRMFVTATVHNYRKDGHKTRVHHGYRINDQFAVYFCSMDRDYLHHNNWVVIHVPTGFSPYQTKTRREAAEMLKYFNPVWFEETYVNEQGSLEWPNKKYYQAAKDMWSELRSYGKIV